MSSIQIWLKKLESRVLNLKHKAKNTNPDECEKELDFCKSYLHNVYFAAENQNESMTRYSVIIKAIESDMAKIGLIIYRKRNPLWKVCLTKIGQVIDGLATVLKIKDLAHRVADWAIENPRQAFLFSQLAIKPYDVNNIWNIVEEIWYNL